MLLIAFAIQAASAPAQAQAVARPAATASASGASSTTLVLHQDTPVELMAPTEVSTAHAAPGMVFKLRVNKPVEVDGRVVIPAGTPAFGQVVTASESGGLGKSGRMTAKLLAIRLGDVEIPLDGETSAKGTGAGSAGVAVLFSGALALFHRGNNAKIKAGELLAGFVARDVVLPVPATPVVTAPTAR